MALALRWLRPGPSPRTGRVAVARKPLFLCLVTVLSASVVLRAQFVPAGRAVDPGVREGDPGAGGPLTGLNSYQMTYFELGLEDFTEVETVEDGLGPRMNLDSCGGCHSQPSIGGTSPAINPQVAFATAAGAQDRLPPFITLNGPVREARFVRQPDGSADGGVHALFTISGRPGAEGCRIVQPDFEAAVADRNVAFRIPTPVFGLGLVEQIPDSAIRANRTHQADEKRALGIAGKVNTNGNDGTVTRFGWKAQNKSLVVFSGEAYNVEMGISNEMFQNERDETPECQYAMTPNDTTFVEAETIEQLLNGVDRFAMFMRLLAAPEPSLAKPGGAISIQNGRQIFRDVGCAYCHTPSFVTGRSSVTALSEQPVNLYSDLLVHNMGPLLADAVSQGAATGDEFRTAPLWGLGQRIFFLHDGRTRDLLSAIQLHASGHGRNASEANEVIERFNRLSEQQKQDLLNFLRSL